MAEAIYVAESDRIVLRSNFLAPGQPGIAWVGGGQAHLSGQSGRRPLAGFRAERRSLRRQVRELDLGLELGELGAIVHDPDGAKPPPMLLEGWLQEAALHLLYGYREDGKSWVALKLCIDVLALDSSKKVLWMDGEQGRRSMGGRIAALGIAEKMGLSAEEIDARFVHLNLSTLTKAGLRPWAEFIVEHEFALVVWDPFGAHLSAAGIDGDRDNDGVSFWFQAMHNPVGRYGGVTLCVDHVPEDKELQERPKGAGEKGNRPRVLYKVKKTAPFDRERVGGLEVVCTKNSDAAEIPRLREIQLGGTPFTFRESRISEESRRREELGRLTTLMDGAMRFLVEQRLKHPDDGFVSKSVLASNVPGKTQPNRKTLDDLVKSNRLVVGDLDYAPFVEIDLRNSQGKQAIFLRATEEAVEHGRWSSEPEPSASREGAAEDGPEKPETQAATGKTKASRRSGRSKQRRRR